MNYLKQQLAERLGRNPDVLSVSVIDKSKLQSSLTDGFDLLLLVISNRLHAGNQLFHYIRDNLRIQERWVDPESLEQWILRGTHRNMFHWILKGEIILDRDTYLEGLRHRMLEFPPDLRAKRLLIEFSGFLRCYLQSKEFVLEEQMLDAYNNIMEALHHWARIVIIEEGAHPEVTVWKQVKTINPGVYKLYEELTFSSETLKQRIELVLLASDFSVMSRLESCCGLLLDILKSRPEAWSMNELQLLADLREVSAELSLLMNKLVQKSVVKELVYSDDLELSNLELRYTIA
ncbi:nucleotidyltransferase-like protein [Paenibacillus thalictri]|uniref:Uncharacterized protein n=1 Tax=Paenibacillus thalictri TaxID=2527873 RepID=A0A4Q9DW42_9BACL|nr:nucleotidyltransferase-like protein [Paenibacillus thalictri]TBL80535.1 hypothetical protein EYB31_04725 [Paenibacillus thalictri]